MAGGDNKDLKEICNELDTLSLRVLQLMNELVQCKLNIEKAVKSGSLDLAKARYIMGNRNVSALQLPTEESTEVVPLVTVERLDKGEGDCGVTDITFHLKRVSVYEKPKTQTPAKQRVKAKARGYNAADKRSDDDEDEDDDDDDDSENQPLLHEKRPTAAPVLQDPIKWFGVLVPQNLRQGQAWFQKAIELSVQSANIQLELDASRRKFEELLRKKTDYLNSVREP